MRRIYVVGIVICAVVCGYVFAVDYYSVTPVVKIVKESKNLICKSGCCIQTYETSTFTCDKEEGYSAPVAQWQ